MENLRAASLYSTKGWTAVVTGGGTGLGLITARALAVNGVRVYITGRRVERLEKAEMSDPASGGHIRAVHMDCTIKQSIQDGVAEISKHEKYVNLLVNNAGRRGGSFGPNRFAGLGSNIAEISKSMFENENFGDWAKVYEVNVAAHYFTSAAFLPLLVASVEHGFPVPGSILNISSMCGLATDSINGQFSYNASKAATLSLSKQLAAEFSRPGVEVRVNTITPGFFPSEMNPIKQEKGESKEHFRRIDRWGIPMGRAGTAEDYAQAVISLAVNQYVSGATLTVDGGWLLVHA